MTAMQCRTAALALQLLVMATAVLASAGLSLLEDEGTALVQVLLHRGPAYAKHYCMMVNGLCWLWASPCSGLCSKVQVPQEPPWCPSGIRYSTESEFEGAQSQLYLRKREFHEKCAAGVLDPQWSHCDLPNRFVRYPDNQRHELVLICNSGDSQAEPGANETLHVDVEGTSIPTLAPGGTTPSESVNPVVAPPIAPLIPAPLIPTDTTTAAPTLGPSAVAVVPMDKYLSKYCDVDKQHFLYTCSRDLHPVSCMDCKVGDPGSSDPAHVPEIIFGAPNTTILDTVVEGIFENCLHVPGYTAMCTSDVAESYNPAVAPLESPKAPVITEEPTASPTSSPFGTVPMDSYWSKYCMVDRAHLLDGCSRVLSPVRCTDCKEGNPSNLDNAPEMMLWAPTGTILASTIAGVIENCLEIPGFPRMCSLLPVNQPLESDETHTAVPIGPPIAPVELTTTRSPSAATVDATPLESEETTHTAVPVGPPIAPVELTTTQSPSATTVDTTVPMDGSFSTQCAIDSQSLLEACSVALYPVVCTACQVGDATGLEGAPQISLEAPNQTALDAAVADLVANCLSLPGFPRMCTLVVGEKSHAEAVGDPHMLSARGRHFELHTQGFVTLLQIPRGSAPNATLLHVSALMRKISRCGQGYIHKLHIMGKWAAEKERNKGGWVIQAYAPYADPYHRQHGRQMRLGPGVLLSVKYGVTATGIAYLNFHAYNLIAAHAPLGGVLGEDDAYYDAATRAWRTPAECVSLAALGRTGSRPRGLSVASGYLWTPGAAMAGAAGAQLGGLGCMASASLAGVEEEEELE